ncbi:MAG: peptidoglycan-binding domain-containing protein [Jannaschia sp.]
MKLHSLVFGFVCLALPASASCPGPSCPSGRSNSGIAQGVIAGAISGAIVRQRPDGQVRGATRRTASSDTATRAEAAAIQRRLNDLGHDAGTPDGLIGQRTRAAIVRWQAAVGEEPTGQLTEDQAASLLRGPTGGLVTSGRTLQRPGPELPRLQPFN